MVPRSELLATEARCRKLEASAKKDSEHHQATWDALNDRLKAAVAEGESLKSAMQVSDGDSFVWKGNGFGPRWFENVLFVVGFNYHFLEIDR